MIIQGSVTGGSGTNSAAIDTVSSGNIGKVTIGGSLLGGTGTATATGAIIAAGNLGSVSVAVNLVGGSISGSSTVNLAESGYITAGHVTSVTIGGSIIAGTNTNTGGGTTFVQDGSIRASDDISTITVKGSLLGNSTYPVIISAVGEATVSPRATKDLAIGSLTVTGRVQFANILAGYNTSTNGIADGAAAITGAVNGGAGIGPVKVGGDWLQSNLVAGVQPGPSNVFGNNDNMEIPTEAGPDLVASIASILIAGQVLGSLTPSSNHYGFVAEQIVAFTLGGTSYKLHAGSGNDDIAIGSTGDVTLLEVA